MQSTRHDGEDPLFNLEDDKTQDMRVKFGKPPGDARENKRSSTVYTEESSARTIRRDRLPRAHAVAIVLPSDAHLHLQSLRVVSRYDGCVLVWSGIPRSALDFLKAHHAAQARSLEPWWCRLSAVACSVDKPMDAAAPNQGAAPLLSLLSCGSRSIVAAAACAFDLVPVAFRWTVATSFPAPAWDP